MHSLCVCFSSLIIIFTNLKVSYAPLSLVMLVPLQTRFVFQNNREKERGRQTDRQTRKRERVCWLLNFPQHASVSQGWIRPDNFMCCHTEIEDADQTIHLTQSQYTDTGPTSPSTDPIMPGTCQGSHWSASF